MTTDEMIQDIQIRVVRMEERLGALPCKERCEQIARNAQRINGLCLAGAEDRGIRKGVLVAYGIATAVGGGGFVALIRAMFAH